MLLAEITNGAAKMGIIEAIKAGQELANPGGWKVFQNWLNLGVASVSIAATFVPGLASVLTPDVISGIAGILGTINIYLTTATTTKIGV
jgi:hypothetical protein